METSKRLHGGSSPGGRSCQSQGTMQPTGKMIGEYSSIWHRRKFPIAVPFVVSLCDALSCNVLGFSSLPTRFEHLRTLMCFCMFFCVLNLLFSLCLFRLSSLSLVNIMYCVRVLLFGEYVLCFFFLLSVVLSVLDYMLPDTLKPSSLITFERRSPHAIMGACMAW